MSTRTFTFLRRPRPARLTVSLSIALGLTLSTGQAGDLPAMQMPSVHYHAASAFDPSYPNAYAAEPYAAAVPTTPSVPPHIVTSCDDDAAMPGTLRYEVLHSVSGDAVDMSSLACSMITLSGWPIRVTQGDLHLKGPSPPAHLTIDANDLSIVLAHYGAGTLDISDLTIASGYFVSSSSPTGGCVYSKGNVSLTRSVVTHCVLQSTSNMAPAIGAGVYTHGDLTLSYSTITHSRAFSLSGAAAMGGGAAVIFGDFKAYHSMISDNSARSTTNISFDGGVHARRNVVMDGSTISSNYAQLDGGIGIQNYGFSATITNSTISSNKAAIHYGGIFTKASLTLDNSTIAFNHSYSGSSVFSDGLHSESPLVLHSSIISGNAGPGGPSDLGGSLAATVTGSDNLITFSTIPTPGGTRTDCPQLEPLANNGGPALTHALKHTSPAIDNGFAGGLTVDQRLSPRTSGVTADIGSVEWQPGETDERIFVSGFDGLCDQ